jgi:hypothetical protein
MRIELSEKDYEQLFAAHQDGRRFVAIHPQFGIVIAAETNDDFQAKVNDKRPSVLKELVFMCTSLLVQEGVA